MRLVAITAGDVDDARLAALAEVGEVSVQVRWKRAGGAALYAVARRAIAIARPRGVPVWVNDRADVALAAGADGLHLPEDGLDVATARALAPRLRLGVSRHRAAIAAEDAEADRLHLGPIWATPSKAGMGAPLGLDALAAARAGFGGALIAVGGIDTPERAYQAARAGADGVAVIRALWEAADVAAVARALVAAVEAGQRARNASQGAP